MITTALPRLYVPSSVVDVTAETVGTTPSITSALLAPREFVAAGAASVNVVAFPAGSFIVPPFNANADVLL